MVEAVIDARPISHIPQEILCSVGSNILISVFQSKSSDAQKPGWAKACIYHNHGGSLVARNRFLALGEVPDWVVEFDGVVVSVESTHA